MWRARSSARTIASLMNTGLARIDIDGPASMFYCQYHRVRLPKLQAEPQAEPSIYMIKSQHLTIVSNLQYRSTLKDN